MNPAERAKLLTILAEHERIGKQLRELLGIRDAKDRPERVHASLRDALEEHTKRTFGK